MRYSIKIIPKSSKNEIIEQHDDFLKIKIKAIPEHGKANEELIKFLSKSFKIPKSNIQIIKGNNSRNKIVEIN
ncbi:MAG TPA: DUF167 domain-containing protein [bacterium]|jgi:hypothetical protein|nr:DUF167 domain-containing protein [bacterium]HOG38418.1 DUF167 domain-containing protein [bacterium]HQI03321.1 DUF167 domain-containing protein [bacterium]